MLSRAQMQVRNLQWSQKLLNLETPFSKHVIFSDLPSSIMEKLVEVSDQVVPIDFVLGTKCRATVRLRSLSATATIAFKVQTSSPHKFLVSPPSGLITPLTQSTFQIILKPQPQIPPSFPRSAGDRFLIRTVRIGSAESTHLDSITSWTYDVRLKVAFVGPFLLRHAVNTGDCDAVRGIIKFQKTILTELSTREAESLYRVANKLDNSGDMVSLLLGAGLKVESATRSLEDVEESRWAEKGWSELHVAVAFDRTDEVSRLIKMGEHCILLDCKDRGGRTPLYLAASKGYERCVRVLAGAGANVDAKRNDGCTALYRAAAKGNRRMVKVLIDQGADPSIVVDDRHHSAVDVARDEGYNEIVKILERGEDVLNAARRGDIFHLESLLERDAGVDFRDQYGLTAIHIAAIKGYKDVVMLLVEFGSNLESTDIEGRTPLHLAVVGGSKDTVEVLINRGANLNAKCNKGATPLQVAQTMGYEIITQLLLLNQPIS